MNRVQRWLAAAAVLCNITCNICGCAMVWNGREYVCTNNRCGNQT